MRDAQVLLKNTIRFNKYDIPFVMQCYQINYPEGYINFDKYILKYENMEFNCKEPYHHTYYGWTTEVESISIEGENYIFITPFHIVTLSHPNLQGLVYSPDEFKEEWINKLLNGDYSFPKSVFEYKRDERDRPQLHPFLLRKGYLTNDKIRAFFLIGKDLYSSHFTYDLGGGFYITEELYNHLPNRWTIKDIMEFCRTEYDQRQATTEYFWQFLSNLKKNNQPGLFILNKSGRYYYAIEQELKYGIRRVDIEFTKDYDMEKGKATRLIKQMLSVHYQNQDLDYDL